VTPNSNVGRYYVEDDITGSMWRNRRTERRLQIAFAQDLGRRGGFWRWLGSHQGAVMYTGAENMRVQQNNNNARIISDNTFDGIVYPAGTNAANDSTRNTRRLRSRFYLDTPQNNSGRNQFQVQAPFNLWDAETRIIGKDSAGRDVVINSGMSNPYGAQVATSNGKKKEDSIQYGLQSSFLEGRLNLTVGERFSKASFAPWVGQGNTTGRLPRRYNALTGTYEEPVRRGTAIVFPSDGRAVGNAGFEPWDAMLSRGGEHDSLDAPTKYDVSSRLKSVVIHPLGRDGIPSLHYTESSSAFCRGFYSESAQRRRGSARRRHHARIRRFRPYLGKQARTAGERLRIRLFGNQRRSAHPAQPGGSRREFRHGSDRHPLDFRPHREVGAKLQSAQVRRPV
jgi:hypothetical protein